MDGVEISSGSSLSSQDPPPTCLEPQLASDFVFLAAGVKILGSEVRLTQALESSLVSLGLLLALREHSARATLAWPATGLPSSGQHIRNSSSCLGAPAPFSFGAQAPVWQAAHKAFG